MRRRDLVALVGAALFWPLTTHAQQRKQLPRIGFLGNSTAALEAKLVEAFRQGLRDFGYNEGEDILIDYRWAEASMVVSRP